MADLSTSEFAARCAIITAVTAVLAMIILWGIKIFLLDTMVKMTPPITIVSFNATKGAIQGAVEGCNSISPDAVRKTAFEVGRGLTEGGLTSKPDVSSPSPR